MHKICANKCCERWTWHLIFSHLSSEFLFLNPVTLQPVCGGREPDALQLPLQDWNRNSKTLRSQNHWWKSFFVQFSCDYLVKTNKQIKENKLITYYFNLFVWVYFLLVFSGYFKTKMCSCGISVIKDRANPKGILQNKTTIAFRELCPCLKIDSV